MTHLLSSFPQQPESWHGSARLQGSQRRFVWIDEDGLVRSLVHRPADEDPADSAWASLVEAIVQPRVGRPARPEAAVFPDAGVARALRERARPEGLEILASHDLPPALLSGPRSSLAYRCDPARVADLFEAAADLTLEAAWCAWEPGEILVLEGLSPRPLFASVLADPPGVALFHSREGLQRFLTFGEARDLAACLRLESPLAVGPQLMADACLHGWPLVDFVHVPLALGGRGHLADRWEIAVLARAVEALATWAEVCVDGRPFRLLLADGTWIHLRREIPLAARTLD